MSLLLNLFLLLLIILLVNALLDILKLLSKVNKPLSGTLSEGHVLFLTMLVTIYYWLVIVSILKLDIRFPFIPSSTLKLWYRVLLLSVKKWHTFILLVFGFFEFIP